MIANPVSKSLQLFGRSAISCLRSQTFCSTSSLNQASSRYFSFMMASSGDFSRIKARSEETDRILAELQGQIEAIKKAAVKAAGLGEEENLLKENEELKKEIQALKVALTVAEIGNGVRQVNLPTKASLAAFSSAASSTSEQDNSSSSAAVSAPAPKAESGGKKNKQDSAADAGGKKAKKEKSEKGAKEKGGDGEAKKGGKPKKGGAGEEAELPMDISRLDLRVGKIVAVEKHPDADGLYIEQVDLGEGRNRTIISGLVKHVPITAMKDRVAVFFCNLKPAKMRGIMSEGMIMCAAGPEKTEILVPPQDSAIGDRVSVKEYPGTPDALLNPKKKVWETLKPDVRTNAERVATFKGAALIVEGKGQVVAPTLSDTQIS